MPEANVQEMLEEKESELRTRKYIGPFTKVISIIAITWSLFQLYVNSFGVLDAIRLRSWHIIFLLLMTFLLYPAYKKEKRKRSLPTVFDLIWLALGIGSFGYLLVNYNSYVFRGGYYYLLIILLLNWGLGSF